MEEALERDAELRREIAKLRLYGPQTQEDVAFMYAFERGFIRTPNEPNMGELGRLRNQLDEYKKLGTVTNIKVQQMELREYRELGSYEHLEKAKCYYEAYLMAQELELEEE